MLYEESLWIKKILAKTKLPAGSQGLDLGSASRTYRTKEQPYIHQNVILPLMRRGIKIIYADKSKDSGVDLVLDIEKIKTKRRYDLVICANILEHVANIKKVVKNTIKLVKHNGYLLVSVPNKYGYHPFPIDNRFRPSAKELTRLFSGQKIIKAETIKDRKPQSHKFKYKVSLVFLQRVR